MLELVKQGTRTPTKGFWESDMVCSKRKMLLDKGAQQGWLIHACELQIGACIGHGSFGQTFEATWRGTRVSTQMLRMQTVSRYVQCKSAGSELHCVNVLRLLEVAAQAHLHTSELLVHMFTVFT